jgi:hypothetical protein
MFETEEERRWVADERDKLAKLDDFQGNLVVHFDLSTADLFRQLDEADRALPHTGMADALDPLSGVEVHELRDCIPSTMSKDGQSKVRKWLRACKRRQDAYWRLHEALLPLSRRRLLVEPIAAIPTVSADAAE